MANIKTGEMIKCPQCGTFSYKSRNQIDKGAKFCSKACRYSAPRPNRLKGRIIACKVCGTKVYRKASEILRGVDDTCSTACRAKWLSGSRNAFYGKFPPLPPRPKKWSRRQRREWIASACARCGSTENLELDHIVPRGPHTRENTQTLCRSCNQRKCWHEDRLHYLATYSTG